MIETHGLNNGYIKQSERDVNNKSLSCGFKSHLKVFNDHNGFVNGELHTLIGTKGSGKSTWSKTMLLDLVLQGKKIILYLSEETKSKYLTKLNELILSYTKSEDKLKDLMGNVIVIEEMSTIHTEKQDLIKYIQDIVDYCKIEIIIFDNFTTSYLSELNITKQSEVLREFKTLATNKNIPVIMFFHTAKLYDSKRLDGDNVRGSATAVNIGSYNYLIAQHQDGCQLRNFIYTEKARYHPAANKKMYELTYNSLEGVFDKCKDYYLEDFRELVSGKIKKASNVF